MLRYELQHELVPDLWAFIEGGMTGFGDYLELAVGDLFGHQSHHRWRRQQVRPSGEHERRRLHGGQAFVGHGRVGRLGHFRTDFMSAPFFYF